MRTENTCYLVYECVTGSEGEIDTLLAGSWEKTCY